MFAKRQSAGGMTDTKKGKWLDEGLSDVEEEDTEDEETDEETEEESEEESDEESDDESEEDSDDSDDEEITPSIVSRLYNGTTYYLNGVKSVFNTGSKYYAFGKAISIELLCATVFLAFPLIVARNAAYKEVMTKYVVKNHGNELKTARTADFLNLD